MGNRCYLRGMTPLGLLNTVLGCLLNRVLVRCRDSETGRTVRWRWDRATDHPPAEEPTHRMRQWRPWECWLLNLLDFRYWRCECGYEAPYGSYIMAGCPKHD